MPGYYDVYALAPARTAEAVERFFGELTRKRIRRGAFKSVAELEAAINAFIEHHNERTEKGYDWTKSAEEIIAKYHRARAALQKANKL